MEETVGKRSSKTPEGENGPAGRPNGLTGVKHGVAEAQEVWTVVRRKTTPAVIGAGTGEQQAG